MITLTASAAELAPTTGSVEDRLNRLEKELEQLRSENKALRDELGVTNTYVKPLGPVQELKIGGLIQVQGEFGDKGDARWTTDNDRFHVRRARLNTVGRFFEDFDFRLELDLEGTLAESSNLRAQLTDGWINYNHFHFAQLKAGQFFPVMGYEKRLNPGLTQSIEYSLAGDRLLPDRQVGAQLWGDAFEKRFGWYFGVFNGMNSNTDFNDNESFMIAPRLEGTPLKGKLWGRDAQWNVGLSAYYSDDDRFPLVPDLVAPGQNPTNAVFAGQRTAAAVDTQFHIGPVDIWAEYLFTHYDPDQYESYDAQGWYVLAGYYLVAKKLQALVKYESFDPHTDISGDTTDAWTFGLNYYVKGNNLKVMFNYLLEDVPGLDDLQNKFIARLQAAF